MKRIQLKKIDKFCKFLKIFFNEGIDTNSRWTIEELIWKLQNPRLEKPRLNLNISLHFLQSSSIRFGQEQHFFGSIGAWLKIYLSMVNLSTVLVLLRTKVLRTIRQKLNLGNKRLKCGWIYDDFSCTSTFKTILKRILLHRKHQIL